MNTSIEQNEYSVINNEDENEEFFCKEFNQLVKKYDIPFTQTSFSRMDLSFFTTKLRELGNINNSADEKTNIRKRWLLFIKNYLLIQRLNDIREHFLKIKSGGQFLLQRKFFRKWANKTVNQSNREKWIRLSTIIYQINWSRKAHDCSSRLNAQRVDIASKYLISRPEYQNPRYNFFIRKALPIITDKQNKILEEELEEDRQADLRNFQGSWTDNRNQQTEPNSITEDFLEQSDELIINRDIPFSPPSSLYDISQTTPRKKKRTTKQSPRNEEKVNSTNYSPSTSDEKGNYTRNIQKLKKQDNSSNQTKNNTKLLIILSFVFLSVFAFVIGFGAPLAYLIHKGEYNSLDDYMNSIKKSKNNDELINENLNQNEQQKIQLNDGIQNEISDVQKRPNESPNEESNQELQKKL